MSSGLTSVFAISASGMDFERTRLDTAALNIANANTTRGVDGALYQPLRAVGTAKAGDFASYLADVESSRLGVALELVSSQQAPRRVHDPSHPDADAEGFVEMPGVDPLTEMTEIMSALRGYEANVRALEAATAMAQRALEIGGRS